MSQALSVDPEGRVAAVKLAFGHPASFREDVRSVIGCESLEAVGLDDGQMCLWADENAIAAGRRVNVPASRLAEYFGMPTTVYGTAVVTGYDEAGALGLTWLQAGTVGQLLESADPEAGLF